LLELGSRLVYSNLKIYPLFAPSIKLLHCVADCRCGLHCMSTCAETSNGPAFGNLRLNFGPQLNLNLTLLRCKFGSASRAVLSCILFSGQLLRYDLMTDCCCTALVSTRGHVSVYYTTHSAFIHHIIVDQVGVNSFQRNIAVGLGRYSQRYYHDSISVHSHAWRSPEHTIDGIISVSTCQNHFGNILVPKSNM
jgi:hypothetical protein